MSARTKRGSNGNSMVNRQAAEIMDGKAVAALVREELKERVARHVEAGKRNPGLAVVLVGENPASELYVKNKIQACKKVGMESFLKRFPADANESDIIGCIEELNKDNAVDGILVQLPLPSHLNSDNVLDSISPKKDADGLHPFNAGQLMAGNKDALRPCTPSGVMVLLDHYKVPLEGKNAVVLGRSNLVGKPVALMLMERHATVTMCHSRTKNLDQIVRNADVVVVAIGKAGLVKGDWIKPGAVVVDVGIHHLKSDDGQSVVVGDVEFEPASEHASLITPVPGGVGPMTVAMLLSNAVKAYEASTGKA